jgi:IMP dehydrogenase
MSYAGASTIDELQEKAEFIRLSPAGRQESTPHDVNTL